MSRVSAGALGAFGAFGALGRGIFLGALYLGAFGAFGALGAPGIVANNVVAMCFIPPYGLPDNAFAVLGLHLPLPVTVCLLVVVLVPHRVLASLLPRGQAGIAPI